MLKMPPAADGRVCKTVRIEADLVVVGGGMSGVCCAVTAARAGIRVALVQDRPVLGGNASSEVRLWILGATSHMGNNNRWAREGGVIDEILVENTFRNPEGNPLMLDALLLEKVAAEPNVTLLLNAAVHDVTKSDADTIASVRAFCSQNSTAYDLIAPLFCDASGDGVVGFMAGAAFRMGAESAGEFGEKFAPTEGYGELLGHTIYFYTKDTGRPVTFVPPSFALKDITRIPRWRQFNTKEQGCKLWWIEYGGLLDTVHDTEAIKWELWKVVYGVWDHIKNSGRFPDAETMTLEWVGTIPGKRESRRFEGDYMLTQQDVVEQRRHEDAVSFGGWAIDLHPADGVFSEKPGCNQWHSKGVYQIPYRCMYSRNIRNLFLAGRIISASHVAFASSRVMATCAHGAQAVGMAASICTRQGLAPRDLCESGRMRALQAALSRAGQYIPHVDVSDAADLASAATVSATGRLALGGLRPAPARERVSLRHSRAMLIPVGAGGRAPAVTVWVESGTATELLVELRSSSREGNHTPDTMLAKRVVHVTPVSAAAARAGSTRAAAAVSSGGAVAVQGARATVVTPPGPQEVTVDFGDVRVPAGQYVAVCLLANPAVSVAVSDVWVTGVLSVAHKGNERVAEGPTQTPPGDIGVETFEFWLPERRPGGKSLAMRFDPPIDLFGPENLTRGPDRPTTQPNAWVADPKDPSPSIELRWPQPVTLERVELSFDTDFDHPMESVLMGHPERVMPFCVRRYRVLDGEGRQLAAVTENHQTRNVVRFGEPVRTDRLVIEVEHPSEDVPAALFRVRCYGPA